MSTWSERHSRRTFVGGASALAWPPTASPMRGQRGRAGPGIRSASHPAIRCPTAWSSGRAWRRTRSASTQSTPGASRCAGSLPATRRSAGRRSAGARGRRQSSATACTSNRRAPAGADAEGDARARSSGHRRPVAAGSQETCGCAGCGSLRRRNSRNASKEIGSPTTSSSRRACRARPERCGRPGRAGSYSTVRRPSTWGSTGEPRSSRPTTVSTRFTPVSTTLAPCVSVVN